MRGFSPPVLSSKTPAALISVSDGTKLALIIEFEAHSTVSLPPLSTEDQILYGLALSPGSDISGHTYSPPPQPGESCT